MTAISFDYIVIGGGSAGCVVAARLSADPAVRVLLLEAGGVDSHPDVADPTRWPKLLGGEFDWQYATVPQRHCHDRIDHVPRGKLLGGCHSLNANAWVRGRPSDFDTWAEQGCTDWDWTRVRKVFQRIEDWHGPPDASRGMGGPLHVAPPDHPHPLAAAFVAAGREVGLPLLGDGDENELLGVGFFDLTIQDGRRRSVASAYLKPALSRPNLVVRTLAETNRILFNGTRCRGVNFLHGGRLLTAIADREVILCAGAIGSPRLLLLSGVGPAEELRRLAIELVVDLPGVGRNLQDHVMLAGINFAARQPLPRRRNNGVESTLWWKSDEHRRGPDLQAVLVEFPLATPALLGRLPSTAPADGFAIAPACIRPASRGSVRLASSDPSQPPWIDPNFLADERDIEVLLSAVDLSRRLAAAAPLREFIEREIIPGDLGRAGLIDFIRHSATTFFHPTGSCRMGVDADAVVDPRLRVHGLQGLRVADASIMPTITSGNTNAPTVMIGEQAADFILAR